MTLRRVTHDAFSGLVLPSYLARQAAAYRDYTPHCLTCLKPTDSEQIVEGYPGRDTFVRILVKCHGAEELVTFDFGTVEWDDYDVRTRFARWRFFDPMASHEDAGREVVSQGGPVSHVSHDTADNDTAPAEPLIVLASG